MRRSTSRRIWLSIAVGAIIFLLPVLRDLFKAPNASTATFSSFPLWIDVVGLVVTASLFSGLTYWSTKLISPSETPRAAASENRQRMLERDQIQWIRGFLENPLYYGYGEQLLPLARRERVGSRFDLVLSDPLAPAHAILSGTTIVQVFDKAKGELLILGEPGAGKTCPVSATIDTRISRKGTRTSLRFTMRSRHELEDIPSLALW